MPTVGSQSWFASAFAAYQKLLTGFSKICVVLTGIALVVLTAIFGWLVYGRYVLNATPTWVEQVALLLVAFITFLGAAVGVRDGTHLSVSLFRDRSPRPVRFAFFVLSHLAMLVFGAVMAVAGYQLAAFKWSTEIPLLHVPEGLRAIPVVVCGCLVVLFSIAHLVVITQNFHRESSVDDDATDPSNARGES